MGRSGVPWAHLPGCAGRPLPGGLLGVWRLPSPALHRQVTPQASGEPAQGHSLLGPCWPRKQASRIRRPPRGGNGRVKSILLSRRSAGLSALSSTRIQRMHPLMWRKLQSPREEMSAKESGRMWLQRGTIPAQSPSTTMNAAAMLPFSTG